MGGGPREQLCGELASGRRRSGARPRLRPRPRSARAALAVVVRRDGREAAGADRRDAARARARPAGASRHGRPRATSSSSPARTCSASAPCAASGSISLGIEPRADLGAEPEPVEAAGGEHDRVEAALAQLPQPRLDVAAHRLDRRATARARAAAPAGAPTRCRCAFPGEARAAPTSASRGSSRSRYAPTTRPVGVGRGHVLRRVDGDVDAPGEERLLDLLDEDAARADLAERRSAVAVARGRDRDERDLDARRRAARPRPARPASGRA